MKNPKFAVLNLNPGLDRVMYLSEPLKTGQLNRANESILSQGSKAANFSIIMKRLGADIEYFSFTGGAFGELCNSFTEREQIKSHYVETKGEVRLNFKIVDSNNQYTEINEKGANINEKDVECLLEMTEKKAFDYLVLSGSLPSGIDVSIYQNIIEKMNTRNIKTVLDCDGDALKLGIKAKPYLIKPNRMELSELAGIRQSSIKTKADAIEVCRDLYQEKKVNILCTLDKDGALYVGGEGEFYRDSLKTEAKGYNGVGDTFLAAFLFSRLQRGFDIQKALDYGVSAATAKIKLQGSTPPKKEDVEKIFSEL